MKLAIKSTVRPSLMGKIYTAIKGPNKKDMNQFNWETNGLSYNKIIYENQNMTHLNQQLTMNYCGQAHTNVAR